MGKPWCLANLQQLYSSRNPVSGQSVITFDLMIDLSRDVANIPATGGSGWVSPSWLPEGFWWLGLRCLQDLLRAGAQANGTAGNVWQL